MTQNAVYDLLILTDATGSMGGYLQSLHSSLPEIIRISALTRCFERIGVLAYRDYCGGKLTEWSGWCRPGSSPGEQDTISQEDLVNFAKQLVADAGGDMPEATKTGLAHCYEVMRAEATTIIVLYTDAPPHLPGTGGSNFQREKAALLKPDSFGGYGPFFMDWISAARTLQSGPKRAKVFALIQFEHCIAPYMYLCTVTGGTCFLLSASRRASHDISSLTIGVLLAWMGLGKSSESDKKILGQAKSYPSVATLGDIHDEADGIAAQYLGNSKDKNFLSTDVWLGNIEEVVCAKEDPVVEFSKAYQSDEKYQEFALSQLRAILEADVTAVAVNPIFGSLWRTVCNDRKRADGAREELVQLFGAQVNRISDDGDRARMKAWLAASYDFREEIEAQIAEVAEEDRFPCVYFDPTQDFEAAPSVEDAENEDPRREDSRSVGKLTRDELLEIGRSCDPRVLRRLGKVLTRLSYVNSKDELPVHIRQMDEAALPRIPMAMAQSKYQRRFWKILLHLVLPGTLLSARSGALLAALTLRVGLQPLRDAADRELILASRVWNNLEIPETWNKNCLALLLDADEDYETRVKQGVTSRSTEAEGRILVESDRHLFQTLVNYKALESNMNTTLRAMIGWQPDKTKVPLGPVTACTLCKFPRSVTIMGGNHECGLCTVTGCKCNSCKPRADQQQRRLNNVSAEDNEQTEATWVECSVQSCRAQYVVYNPQDLGVRPKCFFCRHVQIKEPQFGSAPWVDCSQCLNRIIWPMAYRPEGFDPSEFQCPACKSGRKTIVAHETTPKTLEGENGRAWLLRNDDQAIPEPLSGRTLFHTIKDLDLSTLASKLEILPQIDGLQLTICGKFVHNLPELQGVLRKWVHSRRAEAGSCSLCFRDFRKMDRRPACGRSGCRQLICPGCWKDWYGLNARGRIINIAALSCPFCRRQPTAKTVAPFGLVHLGGLRDAVEEAGSWIYAWCFECGLAKQFVERVCAAGAPPEIREWKCPPCTQIREPMKIRKCPGCKTPTEKGGGCDHITCTVPGCGKHWCFMCGDEFPRGLIYAHMTEKHGGWWGGAEDEEADD